MDMLVAMEFGVVWMGINMKEAGMMENPLGMEPSRLEGKRLIPFGKKVRDGDSLRVGEVRILNSLIKGDSECHPLRNPRVHFSSDAECIVIEREQDSKQPYL